MAAAAAAAKAAQEGKSPKEVQQAATEAAEEAAGRKSLLLSAAEVKLDAARSQIGGGGSPPQRFVVDGVTPSSHQMLRGDCYIFAGSGILEDSYRRYGVERGWFDGSKYMRLSRQALGIAYMEACKQDPISYCPSDEIKAGNTVQISWGNTTEGRDGGDEKLFAVLSDLAVLPEKVCPYQSVPSSETDWRCDGLADARKRNPLRFKVKSWKTHFARDDIKRTLVEDGRPLSLGLGEVKAFYYAPCDAGRGCDEKTADCAPCPLERVYRGVSCCVAIDRPCVNMRGEWFHQPHEPLVQAGGHAINIVGFNDHFRTNAGYEGGWIVRNTWEDGVGVSHGMRARGSHSAAYFMQDVGELEEAQACPNPHSPRSWMPCKDADECLSPMTAMSAESTRKVLRLECVDNGAALPEGACESGDNYYLQNISGFGASGLYTACFLRVPSSAAATSRCYPPVPLDDLPMIFGPADEELERVGVNDPELCGFNFIPFNTYEALQSRFGDVIATSYDIEWTESSYAARRAPGYDYSLVQASTKPLKAVPKYAPSRYRANGL